MDWLTDRTQQTVMVLALFLLVAAVWGFWKALGQPPEQEQLSKKRRTRRRAK